MAEYSEVTHADRIWTYVSPLLLLFGTVGNVLTIVVLSRRRSRNSSTAAYLCALAVSDIVVLNTGLLRQWVTVISDFDMRTVSVANCKIHLFLVYLSTQCSSWFLVAVTTERFVGVWLPHKVKHGCTRRTALMVIAGIVTTLSFLNSHWFYGLTVFSIPIDNETSQAICDTEIEVYSSFLFYTWPWIDLCVFCLVPFLVLFCANVSIIVKLLLSRQKTKTQIKHSKTKKAARKDDRTSQLTAMLMLLNAVFFINIAPISIFLVGSSYWNETSKTEHEEAIYDLWWAIVNMFMYLNNAVNFVLYFLSGSRFRAEVRSLFCGGRGKSIFRGGTTSKVGPARGTSQTHTHTQEELSAADNSADIKSSRNLSASVKTICQTFPITTDSTTV